MIKNFIIAELVCAFILTEGFHVSLSATIGYCLMSSIIALMITCIFKSIEKGK
jgi:hypothetical protein